jgi:Tol biopolymer transport system component
MLRVLCTLAVICVGGLAAGVSPALGAFPGGNGKIAFDSDRGGDPNVWTMDPNGGRLANLTAGSTGAEFGPKWSADGRKILFMTDRTTAANNPEGDIEIFVMNADGSHQKQITANIFDDENPAFSPDGRKIVFQRDLDPVRGQSDYEIFVMKANGTGEKQLTKSPGLDLEPAWSPDGRTIAFSSERDPANEWMDIFVMRPDGSNVRQLTFGAPDAQHPSGFDNEYANWSPDGRMIAFNSSRTGPFEVFVMRADGADQTRITVAAPGENGSGLPAWSPNGRKLTFASDRTGNPEIYTMGADGRSQVALTHDPAFDLSPDWQPLNHHHHHHGDDGNDD